MHRSRAGHLSSVELRTPCRKNLSKAEMNMRMKMCWPLGKGEKMSKTEEDQRKKGCKAAIPIEKKCQEAYI